jgi:hypothetical protein
MVPLVRRQRCVELAEHVPAVRVNLTGSAAAVTVMNTPTSLQRTHLFIQGSDGRQARTSRDRYMR